MTETELKILHDCVKDVTPHNRAWVLNRDVMELVAEVRRLQAENAELAKATELKPLEWEKQPGGYLGECSNEWWRSSFGDFGFDVCAYCGSWAAAFRLRHHSPSTILASRSDKGAIAHYASLDEAKDACEQYRRDLIAALRGGL